MASGNRILISAAAVGSAVIIVTSLFVVAMLFNDINNFYNEIITEMGDFQVVLERLKIAFF